METLQSLANASQWILIIATPLYVFWNWRLYRETDRLKERNGLLKAEILILRNQIVKLQESGL